MSKLYILFPNSCHENGIGSHHSKKYNLKRHFHCFIVSIQSKKFNSLVNLLSDFLTYLRAGLTPLLWSNCTHSESSHCTRQTGHFPGLLCSDLSLQSRHNTAVHSMWQMRSLSANSSRQMLQLFHWSWLSVTVDSVNVPVLVLLLDKLLQIPSSSPTLPPPPPASLPSPKRQRTLFVEESNAVQAYHRLLSDYHRHQYRYEPIFHMAEMSTKPRKIKNWCDTMFSIETDVYDEDLKVIKNPYDIHKRSTIACGIYGFCC